MTTTVLRLGVTKVGLVTTRVLIRGLGFRQAIAILSSVPRVARPRISPESRWAREISIAADRPIGGTCLERSVLLWFILRQHGIDGHLRIGVAKGTDGIDGHAWLEWQGSILNDTPDFVGGFAVFDDDPVALTFR